MSAPRSLLLRDLLSDLKLVENPSDFLASKLRERSLSAQNTSSEQHDDDNKAQGGIPCAPQICATESDVDVSERESNNNQDSSVVSEVVEKLLPIVKSKIVHLVGREEEKKLLLSRLLSPDSGRPLQFTSIPIVGPGGIGKTALARLIYEDRKVRDHFELKAWVEIVDEGQGRKRQLFDMVRKLLMSATGMLCALKNLDEAYEVVIDTIISRRSLIVLDDFDHLEMELWQHLKDSWFRFVGLGSKIIIVTRNPNRAAEIGERPFYLEPLSQQFSWSLYSSLAFSPSSERDEDAKHLVSWCKGVPLYLKLLGSLMRFEGAQEILEGVEPFRDDSSVLLISVLSLPSDLFNCFAYCGIFPCDYLEKEKLIKLWIADDVIRCKKASVSTDVEDMGEACFHQLLCRSFFTEITCNEYGEIVQARMHNVVHRLAQKIARLVYKDKVACAFDVDANSLSLSVATPFQEVRVHNPKLLQTLVACRLPQIPDHHLIPIRSFIELKRLRSLDLSRSGIRTLSKSICMLKKLRYLNLSHTLLTKLPKSCTSLTRLETLDLSRCYYLKALPKKISNLSKLRHLDLSQCNSLCYTPSRIGHLHSLITMPLYVLGEASDSRCATLKELSELKGLRGVLHIKNLENVKESSQAREADLIRKMVQHLELSWNQKEVLIESDQVQRVLECLEPNPDLRALELTGYNGSGFPSWMPNLRCLVRLVINDCTCSTLPKLGELQLLKELELNQMPEIISVDEEFYGDGNGDGDVFPSLEVLKLHGMGKLSNWSPAMTAQGGFLPKLYKLSIQDCPELKRLPTLASVKELVVWRSHSEILPLLTRIESVSSLVVNDMDVKEGFQGSSSMNSVKKLIIVHSTDLDVLESSHIENFTCLKHLRILHCLELKCVTLTRSLGSLEKINMVDCQNLQEIQLITQEFTLKELIIEDCSQLTTIHIPTSSTCSLRKLLVKNCPTFSISSQKLKELRLDFLFITGCPKMRK